MQQDERSDRVEFAEEVFFALYEEAFMKSMRQDVVADSFRHFQESRFCCFFIQLEKSKKELR